MSGVAMALLVIAGLVLAPPGLAVLFTAFNARRAERKVPVDGRFITVEGARLHYVEQGDGPPIVLVHGLGGQLRNFTYALTARLAAHHRVICVDRPGSGYSIADRGPHPGLEKQAAIVARFIRALELDRPLLVGHSLGGAVALGVALDHPDAIGGIALLSPLTQRQDIVPDAFRMLVISSAWLRWLIAWTVAAPLGLRNRERGRKLVFGPDPAPADFDTRGGGALVLRPRSFQAAASEVSAGQEALGRMSARYGTLNVPIGVLFARDDAILDPAVHGDGLVAVVPAASMERIAGGHMFPVTSPDATARWLRGQAKRIREGRPA